MTAALGARLAALVIGGALLAIGAAATLGAELGYAIVQFLLGVDAPVSWLLLREIVTTVLVNALISPPVYAISRRWLDPSLPDAMRRRRRAARPGLIPLS